MNIFASLKERNFRLYFIGMSISLNGTWIQNVALGWMVYSLTGSLVLLSASTFMAQIPNFFVTPFASILIDRFDRRKLLLITQTIAACQALLLAILALTGTIQIWHILLLSLCLGLANSLDIPTRQAFYPSLVPHEMLGNAIALNSTVINAAKLFGPALGGVMVKFLGEGICFLVNAISFVGVIVPLLMMKNVPNPIPKERRNSVMADFKEGFRYTVAHIPIRNLLILLSCTSLFGLPLMTYIPAFVKDILHGDSMMQSLLYGGVGAGAVAASICLAVRKTPLGLGHFAATTGLMIGAALIVLSRVASPIISALLCVPIGFGVIANVAAINTVIQHLSLEDKRGRVMGYLSMAFNGLAPISGLMLSGLREYVGLSGILAICGCGVLVGGVWFLTRCGKMMKIATPAYKEKGILVEGMDAKRVSF